LDDPIDRDTAAVSTGAILGGPVQRAADRDAYAGGTTGSGVRLDRGLRMRLPRSAQGGCRKDAELRSAFFSPVGTEKPAPAVVLEERRISSGETFEQLAVGLPFFGCRVQLVRQHSIEPRSLGYAEQTLARSQEEGIRGVAHRDDGIADAADRAVARNIQLDDVTAAGLESIVLGQHTYTSGRDLNWERIRVEPIARLADQPGRFRKDFMLEQRSP